MRQLKSRKRKLKRQLQRRLKRRSRLLQLQKNSSRRSKAKLHRIQSSCLMTSQSMIQSLLIHKKTYP
jgi:hypothetical protein